MKSIVPKTVKLLLMMTLLLNINASCYADDSDDDNDTTEEVEAGESPESRSQANSDDGAAALAESDKGVDDDGEKVWKMEALEYYDVEKHPDNLTFEMSRQWAIDFAQKMYKAGAEKVWVTRIAEMEIEGRNYPMSDDLLIVLPTDPSKRKAVFEVWNSEMEDEEMKLVDVGQLYIFLVAD